jgi:multisubunit Na+/H+ antiporter MnhG subunit
MGLDIRWPIGLMFSLIGVLLTGYGALTSSNADLYKRSLDINVNLCWGLVLLVFGVVMLILAWRGKAKSGPPAAADKP